MTPIHASSMSMRSSRSALLSVLALLLVAPGCHDTTEPATEAPIPSLSGATVEHTTDDFFGRVADPSTGYSVYLGGTAEEFAEYCATGTFESTSRWEELSVTRPSGAVHFRDRGRDLPVVVYGAVYYEVCDGTEPVFATGTVDVVYTDNDFFFDGPGAFSFGFTGSGTVTTAVGARYRLHMVARTHVRPDGEYKENAKVTITPIR